MPPRDEPLGAFRSFVAAAGAAFIYFLIRVFGSVVRESDVPWLSGPTGGEVIGDAPYEELARKEGLTLVRRAREGGLIPRFDELASAELDLGRLPPAVREFYENTAGYRMDVWAETSFPGSVGLWLLVTTISRKVNQLNFPLRVLESAKGMDSEIVLLRDAGGETRYTGWYRRLVESGRVIYTGFYMTGHVPRREGRVVKVVFPMPGGNATVMLAPRTGADGVFELSSAGSGFGDVGFYRVQRVDVERLRVWYVRSLEEHFRLYVDEHGVLRCDHSIRFLGLPVLRLHYRIDRATAEGGEG